MQQLPKQTRISMQSIQVNIAFPTSDCSRLGSTRAFSIEKIWLRQEYMEDNDTERNHNCHLLQLIQEKYVLGTAFYVHTEKHFSRHVQGPWVLLLRDAFIKWIVQKAIFDHTFPIWQHSKTMLIMSSSPGYTEIRKDPSNWTLSVVHFVEWALKRHIENSMGKGVNC